MHYKVSSVIMPVKFTLMLLQFLLIVFVLATRVRYNDNINTDYRKNTYIRVSPPAMGKTPQSTRRGIDRCWQRVWYSSRWYFWSLWLSPSAYRSCSIKSMCFRSCFTSSGASGPYGRYLIWINTPWCGLLWLSSELFPSYSRYQSYSSHSPGIMW